ncbi:MAG: hypothetical protein HUU03_07435 [Planctomycetaceae bacterium]|nr:hypothetical protein [Planctomycetota bacterium]MCQ3950035.1 hypothetical protein [Planctomycetota bacterium]NUO16258.1 hypothetical protein [Planctomycetaceae bacterium]GIK51841.1 MAG: hypothetical protein BroJett014_08140 [Planctomycetota bacterium]HRJ79409.1 hypothetical protein [Planctomycetota bacterium]
MEIQFSNSDLASILMRPQQMRTEMAFEVAALKKVMQVQKATGEEMQKLVQEATQLGRSLDVRA